MKLAVIDIGTNSIRTLIAEANPDGSFRTLDELKALVRLGAGETQTEGLTEQALSSALKILEQSRRLTDAYAVDSTVAVATSALREARNGSEFLDRLKQATGIETRIISAEEEARLIYRGACAGLDRRGERVLVVDVGGGSVEFIIGDCDAIDWLTSVQLGVLRLLNLFPFQDRISGAQVQVVRAHIDAAIHPALSRLTKMDFNRVIGTSSTNLILIGQALEQMGDVPATLHNQTAPTARVAQVCEWLIQSRAQERERIKRIPPGRKDTIVMGAILWDYLLAKVPFTQITASECSLRHGLLIEFMEHYNGNKGQ